MISPDHVRQMARYNRWQNRSLYTAASGLGDAERRAERGAFWGSIHGTLSHIYWGDSIWMNRFAGTPKPDAGMKESPALFDDWTDLSTARAGFDETIIAWADGVAPAALDGELVWFSGGMGREVARPRWLAITHFFNHQTHHRGQVHAMLTAAGARPEDTDLVFMGEVA